MSAPPHSSAQEFRPYRRFVTLLALALIVVGSGHLLVSVGVSIYRQRHAVRTGAPVGAPMSTQELRGCLGELADVTEALQKHLGASHYLLDGYDQAEAQRWADEGAIWRNRWRVLGERCRLDRPSLAAGPKGVAEVASAYAELADIEAVYSRELLGFVREQAPRMDRLRTRIGRIGARLDDGEARAGEQRP